MKKKGSRLAAALAALLIFSILTTVNPAFAFSPTPTPTPAETPTPSPTPLFGFGTDRLENHFEICTVEQDQITPLPVSLLYSNQGGIMADGFLFFLPLEKFIEYYYDPPVVCWDGTPFYQISYDSDYLDHFCTSVTYYEPSEETYTPIYRDDGEPVTPENLEPGDYLVKISVDSARGSIYFSGAAFITLVIP